MLRMLINVQNVDSKRFSQKYIWHDSLTHNLVQKIFTKILVCATSWGWQMGQFSQVSKKKISVYFMYRIF